MKGRDAEFRGVVEGTRQRRP